MPEWARFQKWVARNLGKAGLKARCNSQAHSGLGNPDVSCEPWFIECKSYESKKPDIQKAIMQAKLDAINNPDAIPVAITKFKGDKPVVSMDFDTFVQVAKLLKEKRHD